MRREMSRRTCLIASWVGLLLLAKLHVVLGAPANYNIDPTHTFPSFEADHDGGLSIWRGKLESTKGTISMDRAAHSGTVDITMDAASINFGYEKMTTVARSEQILDVEKYPVATYRGSFTRFDGDNPIEVDGMLTLHGVTKQVRLTINSFMCKTSAIIKREKCGADASGVFNRADFGINFGSQMGFKMDVKLAIQVEAIKVD